LQTAMALFLSFCVLAVLVGAQTPEQRAQQILSQMTQDEKITMIHGAGSSYTGYIPKNTRLNIPAIQMNDGPQGFRDNAHPGTTTQWPGALTVSQTWDVNLLYQFGQAMGLEFFQKGANVQLGPGLNVARVPTCGRNFEYLSGEDPFLGAQAATQVVKGIQSQKVIATAKHYINNNQEQDRNTVSANDDERTRMEIYAPPFFASVAAGVGSIMCSYNKINNVYACENQQTLNTELKGYAGFEYWVMSDWGATHSTVNSANGGLDQEMPSANYYSPTNINNAISSGQISQNTVNNMVYRILVSMFAIGIFDIPEPTGNITSDVTSSAHNTLARNLAAQAIVLLKNNNKLLPLSKTVSKIGVFGKPASTNIITGGGGSGSVVPKYQITPLQGISNAANQGRTTTCTVEQNIDYYQPGNPSAPAKSSDDCCSQCENRGDCYAWTYVSTSGLCYFKPNADGRQSSQGLVSGQVQGKANISYCDGSNVDTCVTLAGQVDVAICVMATTSSEGSDRPNLQLPSDQVNLCTKVGQANKNTIAVTINPGAILTPPWDDSVAAILAMGMPGQEEGNALGDVLFGAVNPSGRLPVTFPNHDNEINFTQSQYPGVNLQANYSEKLLVGYRWYASSGTVPKYPFGHGLSYTTFSYTNLVVSGRTVSATITNTGSVAGAEVAQLYIGFPASAGEPPIQLKGFSKVSLNPGTNKVVSWTLSDKDLSIWDASTHKWVLQTGTFNVNVGASCMDFKLKGTMNVT